MLYSDLFSITSAEGYTPIFNAYDNVLARAATMDEDPKSLRQILKVQMVLNRLNSAITETNNRGSDQGHHKGPILASFQHELNQLEEEMSAEVHGKLPHSLDNLEMLTK